MVLTLAGAFARDVAELISVVVLVPSCSLRSRSRTACALSATRRSPSLTTGATPHASPMFCSLSLRSDSFLTSVTAAAWTTTRAAASMPASASAVRRFHHRLQLHSLPRPMLNQSSVDSGLYKDALGTLQINLQTAEVYFRDRILSPMPSDIQHHPDVYNVSAGSVLPVMCLLTAGWFLLRAACRCAQEMNLQGVAIVCAAVSTHENRKVVSFLHENRVYEIACWQSLRFDEKETLQARAAALVKGGQTDDKAKEKAKAKAKAKAAADGKSDAKSADGKEEKKGGGDDSDDEEDEEEDLAVYTHLLGAWCLFCCNLFRSLTLSLQATFLRPRATAGPSASRERPTSSSTKVRLSLRLSRAVAAAVALHSDLVSIQARSTLSTSPALWAGSARSGTRCTRSAWSRPSARRDSRSRANPSPMWSVRCPLWPTSSWLRADAFCACSALATVQEHAGGVRSARRAPRRTREAGVSRKLHCLMPSERLVAAVLSPE